MSAEHEDVAVPALLKRVKVWHLAIALCAGLVAFGVGVGRFEAKTSAQEQRIAHLELETKSDVTDFKEEVLRHLDELARQQHETDRRIDANQDVLRNIASDVAVLCSKTHGDGCSRR
jgi:hypothetical protein